MVIDTVIRNTKIGDKLLAHYQKTEKLSLEEAIKKLEELTPLAKNPKLRSATVPPASPSLSQQATLKSPLLLHLPTPPTSTPTPTTISCLRQ